MQKYLIEVQHGGDKTSCLRSLKAFLRPRNHLVMSVEWGCFDEEHKAHCKALLDSMPKWIKGQGSDYPGEYVVLFRGRKQNGEMVMAESTSKVLDPG